MGPFLGTIVGSCIPGSNVGNLLDRKSQPKHRTIGGKKTKRGPRLNLERDGDQARDITSQTVYFQTAGNGQTPSRARREKVHCWKVIKGVLICRLKFLLQDDAPPSSYDYPTGNTENFARFPF